MNCPAARLYLRQVIIELEAKPKARGAAEGLFEPHCHFGGHPQLAVDNPRQRFASYPKRLGAVCYSDASLVEAIPDKVAGVIGILHWHDMDSSPPVF